MMIGPMTYLHGKLYDVIYSIRYNLTHSRFAQVFTLFLLINIFAVQPGMGVGVSMMPTMNGGELFYVNKLINKSDLDYGDFVKIDCDFGVSKSCVKRVIAKPGDHIKIENNLIHINGELVKRTVVENNNYSFSKPLIEKSAMGYIKPSFYKEILPNGTSYHITVGTFTDNGRAFFKKVTEINPEKHNLSKEEFEQAIKSVNRMGRGLNNVDITLSENQFYVLGDNRILSNDSYNKGPIHWDHVNGEIKVLTTTWLRYPMSWFY
jgi:signal peptidase I